MLDGDGPGQDGGAVGGALRSAFSTHALRQQAAANTSITLAWQDAMSVFCHAEPITSPEELTLCDPASILDGHIETILFPGFMTAHIAASGQRFSRNARYIASDGMDGILVQCTLAGDIYCRIDGAWQPSRTGDVRTFDLSRETEACASAFDSIMLVLPRQRIADAGLDPDALHLRLMHGDQTLVRMLSSQIVNLHRNADHIAFDDAEVLLQSILALLRSVLKATPMVRSSSMSGGKDPLTSIRQYIDKNLRDPDLGPTQIARAIGVSRASLYRLAEPLGGIQRFIRGRRLRYAFRCLTTRAGQTDSISNLAFETGFGSEASFRRAFRDTYGISPREVRDLGTKAYGEITSVAASRGHEPVCPAEQLPFKRWAYELLS